MLILNLGFFWTCQSCTVFAYVKPPSLGPHDNANFRRFCRACLQFNWPPHKWLLQQSWNHFGKSAFVRLNRSNVNSVVVTRDFLGYCWKSSDLISEAPYWPFDKGQWANCMSPSILYLGQTVGKLYESLYSLFRIDCRQTVWTVFGFSWTVLRFLKGCQQVG